MSDNTLLAYAYALISSIKRNIPNSFEDSNKWVMEYHSVLDKVEVESGLKMDDFRIPKDEVKNSVVSGNYVTGEVHYREELWREKTILLQKVDAVLAYLQLLMKTEDRKIGF